jgi:kinetochore protein Mis13/DSN1
MNTQPSRRKSKRLAGETSGEFPSIELKLCTWFRAATDTVLAYDEEDGDFKFTRRSKRTKTEPAAPEPVPLPARSRQNKAQQAEPPAEKKSRRKMSFSTPTHEASTISQPKRATRNSTRLSIDKSRNGTSSSHETMVEEAEADTMDLVGMSTTENDRPVDSDVRKESTKIALPFTDTPVINRNKELRKKGTGNRRSSLGMRGRRASSLIENGHNAIPHHQVETSQFYKHIEAEGLSEPRRMKQLLTWCGERALGAKPSHNIADSAAVLAGEK